MKILKALLWQLMWLALIWIAAMGVGFLVAILVAGFNFGYNSVGSYVSTMKGLF